MDTDFLSLLKHPQRAGLTGSIEMETSTTTNPNQFTDAWDDTLIELYVEKYESLVGSARRYLNQRSTAEEAVQDAFMRYHTSGARHVAQNPIAYLRTMVVNNARSMVRSQICREKHRPTELTLAPTIEETCVANEQAQLLRRACEDLPAQQRAVLTLRYWQGLSEAEIAAELGITTGSVKTHASRGRRALRGVLGAAAAA